MHSLFRHLPALCLLLFAVPAAGAAGNGEADVPVLPPVTVVGETVAEPLTGRSTLDAETLDTLPARDSTLNDLLRILPGVQANEFSDSSLAGGEILPPELSISGGKVYQNNFVIDGLGNNNLIDPLADDPGSATLLPGRAQEILLDPELVERVTVYDSNIPAEFGGFTGGVVDVETRRPGPDLSGRLSYRTTRDEWTELYVAADDEEGFGNSDSAAMQPGFTKHDAGATLNIPLGPRSGLVASYQQLYSRIPLQHLGETRTETRRNQNYFLKLGGAPGSAPRPCSGRPTRNSDCVPEPATATIPCAAAGCGSVWNGSRPLPSAPGPFPEVSARAAASATPPRTCSAGTPIRPPRTGGSSSITASASRVGWETWKPCRRPGRCTPTSRAAASPPARWATASRPGSIWSGSMPATSGRKPAIPISSSPA